MRQRLQSFFGLVTQRTRILSNTEQSVSMLTPDLLSLAKHRRWVRSESGFRPCLNHFDSTKMKVRRCKRVPGRLQPVTLVKRVKVGRESEEKSRKLCTAAARNRGKVFRTDIASKERQTNRRSPTCGPTAVKIKKNKIK